jgi:hypothetical protein
MKNITRAFVASFAVLFVLGGFFVPGNASAANPIFTATIAPATALSGSTQSYSVILTNSNANGSGDKIKSATLSIPAGFLANSPVVTSPSSWTASIVGSQIQMSKGNSGAEFPKNTTLTLTLNGTAPAAAGVYTWTAATCKDDTFPCPANKVFDISGPQPTVTVTVPPPGNLTIIKNTVGGIGNEAFTFTGNTGVASLTTVAHTAQQTVSLAPGSGYNITETVPAGWALTSSNCTNGTISAITVVSGQTTTCTLTNSKKGHIIVDKVTNPTADSQSFAFTTTGAGYNGFNLADATAPNDQELVPGNYSVTETSLAGWDLTGLSCSTGGSTNLATRTASINLSAGATVTCTFTNNKKGHLIVEKTTVPAADVTEFSVNITGDGTITGSASGTITDATDKSYEVTAGTYSVAETVPTGWDKTGDTCQNVSVASGETKTCTITNTKRASITVKKNVVNPSGGEVSDNQSFTVARDGMFNQSVSENTDVVYDSLLPGNYTITESANSNYDFVSFSQDNDLDLPGAQVTITAGQALELTITNKQHIGHLTVTKTVDNSHLPEVFTHDANDFTFDVSNGGPTGLGFDSEEGSMTGQNSFDINPGTYTITEADAMGYAVGYQGCMDVVISSGQSATCNISNHDLEEGKGAITVFKNVTNNDGGTITAGTFPLKITYGPEGEQTVLSVTNGQVHQFEPGTYTVSESMSEELSEKYTQTNLVCTDNGSPTANPVVLEAGHVYQCTITNDDKPAHLTIVKHTGNESYNGTFNFTVTGMENPVSIATAGGTGQSEGIALNKGSYDVQELVLPDGWDFGNVVCQYEGNDVGNSVIHGEHITVDNGTSVTCTFTNNRQTGSLKVIKVVQGGGETTFPSSFMIHVKQGESEVSNSPQAGNASGTTYNNLPTGSYTVSETGGPEGFAASFSEGCPNGVITVTNDGASTCTITNVKAGTLIINKTVVNDNSGTKHAADFSFVVNGGSSVAFTQDGENALAGHNTVSVAPGTYTVTEPAVAGYASVMEGCTEISIAAGETKTCTITNNDIAVVTHTLTYTAAANGTLTGTTPQTVNDGTDGTAVTAVGNGGFHFLAWSDESTANPRTDLHVTADHTVTALFAADSASGNGGSVTVSGGGGGGRGLTEGDNTPPPATPPAVLGASTTDNGPATPPPSGNGGYLPPPVYTPNTGSYGSPDGANTTGGTPEATPTPEPTKAPEVTPPADTTNNQTAALSDSGSFWPWFWIILLLIILALLYYWYRRSRGNNTPK